MRRLEPHCPRGNGVGNRIIGSRAPRTGSSHEQLRRRCHLSGPQRARGARKARGRARGHDQLAYRFYCRMFKLQPGGAIDVRSVGCSPRRRECTRRGARTRAPREPKRGHRTIPALRVNSITFLLRVPLPLPASSPGLAPYSSPWLHPGCCRGDMPDGDVLGVRRHRHRLQGRRGVPRDLLLGRHGVHQVLVRLLDLPHGC